MKCMKREENSLIAPHFSILLSVSLNTVVRALKPSTSRNCWKKLKDMNKAHNLLVLFSADGSSAKSFYGKIRSLGQPAREDF